MPNVIIRLKSNKSKINYEVIANWICIMLFYPNKFHRALYFRRWCATITTRLHSATLKLASHISQHMNPYDLFKLRLPKRKWLGISEFKKKHVSLQTQIVNLLKYDFLIAWRLHSDKLGKSNSLQNNLHCCMPCNFYCSNCSVVKCSLIPKWIYI